MQAIAHDGCQELADILEECVVLDTIDHGGILMHIVEFDGQDILIFSDKNNHFWSVYPCHVFDAESGGSVHGHARAINAENGRAPAKGDFARDD